MATKEHEYLVRAGFSKEQADKILEGKRSGINAMAYAKKEYLPMQMHQIMLGLQEKLPVEVYAKPDYDWFQMEEIRLGLKNRVDVSLYASPDISYEKMRQLRKGLEAGINLSDYMQLDAGVMRELRRSKIEGVDILHYIDRGYDAEQLREIRHALISGVDLKPYLLLEYRAASIAEIREGLEKGLDVSVYANIQYSWRQMREIRKGLERRVDIRKYNNVLYTWAQMREIRKGLENGLDVDMYRSMRFTEREMRKKRNLLMDKFTERQINALQSQVKSEDFMFEFMTDDMEVYVTVLSKNKTITKKRFMEILELNDIRKGIVEETVEKIANGEYSKKMLVAKGKIPHKGEDGWYEFFFRTSLQRKPKVLKNGDVDYRQIDWFEMVKEGQKLAFYHEAQEGEDGYNVKGAVLKARKGIEQRILTGQGFELETDKKTYIATASGMATIENNVLKVTNHMEVEEVNLSTGDIDFRGSVYIKGDVGSGVSVRASGDVVIDGNVESATIESMGSVVLKKGMNAAGHGLIKAKKDVVSRFFDSVKVVAGGNIEVGKSLNSQLYAEGMITSSGTIAGGVLRAEGGFRVRHVGNQVGIKTVLQVKANDSVMEEYNIARKTIMEVKEELQMLNDSYEDFKEKFPPEVRSTMEMFQKVEKAVFTKSKQLAGLEQIHKELAEKIGKIKEARVIITGCANEGTTVELDGNRWLADNQTNIVIRKQDAQIEVVQG